MAIVTQQGDRDAPLISGAAPRRTWREVIVFGDQGWFWATGSRMHQLLTAAILLLLMMIALSALVLLGAANTGGKGGMQPAPSWKVYGGSDGKQLVAMMPILGLNLQDPKTCNVKPQESSCPLCRCDWGPVTSDACKQTNMCASCQGEGQCTVITPAKKWCNSTYIKDNAKPLSHSSVMMVALLVLVFALSGMMLFFLQLKGSSFFGKRFVTKPPSDVEKPLALGQKIWYRLRPVIDRAMILLLLWVFCCIAVGMAAGSAKYIEPLEFTMDHKSCFDDTLQPDCPRDPKNPPGPNECQASATVTHTGPSSMASLVSDWQKWGGSGVKASGKNAMFFSIVATMVIMVLLGVLVLTEGDSPTPASNKGEAPTEKLADVSAEGSGAEGP